MICVQNLLDHSVFCSKIVPLSSHHQRLHNVEVALSSLGRSMPVYERSAEAVVDGHREKTLALLWSIIFHFKVSH